MPDGVRSKTGLGRNLENAMTMNYEHAPQRENVEDALLIVESYGPWGADLNDAHRRQIVLADEVLRLRKLYEMAVQGRAEMRNRVKELTLAEDGAKEAFGAVVHEKRDLEAKCKNLRRLLDAAYSDIRQAAARVA